MVVKGTSWWQSQVILYYLNQGGPMIKCAFLTYHASVCCSGRRRMWMLESSIVLCSWLQWGMSERRLHPSVLHPVSIIPQFRSFTSLPSSCSLQPLKGRCTDTSSPLLSIMGFFLSPSFSALFSPVAFPYLVYPIFFLLSQFLVSHHQSWIFLNGGAVQPLNLQLHYPVSFPW